MPRKSGGNTSAPTPEPAGETGDIEDDSTVTESPGIIVLHPGSCYLRIGLSSQLDPHSIPHLIAYHSLERTSSTAVPLLKYGSGGGGAVDNLVEDGRDSRDSGLGSITEYVTGARAKSNVFDAESDINQYGPLNEASPVVPCTELDDVTFQWSDPGLSTNTPSKYIIGNEALFLPPNAPYVLYKPLRYGTLNTSPTISRTAVLKQLEDLWCRAIEECLDIPRKEFKFYRVIMCVPDMVDRLLYKDFMNILLNELQFEAALIHQESVCATYGAGVSAACVVDIGEEKTSLCCVEDGMSNANTRLLLKYGGNDISRFFYWLLQKAGFPYKSCSVDNILDGNLIAKLKEKYCHYDMTVWGVAEEEVIVPHAGKGGVKFSIHFADELVYAPMSVYEPEVFINKDNELMRGQENQLVLPEDIYDEVNWGSEQNTLLKGSSNTSSKNNGGQESQNPSVPAGPLYDVTKRLDQKGKKELMSLEEAVHFTIDCASSQEMKKKLYGSILLIGGGLSFSQASLTLKNKLEGSLPQTITGVSDDTIEVCSNPRDLDPSYVSWRGGAVLAALDCCTELWIERQEWELFGVRLLRERSVFVW